MDISVRVSITPTSLTSTLQKLIPSIFSLISLLMDPSDHDIAPHPKHGEVFKHTTTPGAPQRQQRGDITDHDTVAGKSDMSGLEGTTAEPLASSKRLLEAGRSLSYHENLAAELRFKLFSYMPDLPTLRSLVHTSPTLHAHYIYSRDSILRACVDRELDGFIVDAYANLMSRVRELGSP